MAGIVFPISVVKLNKRFLFAACAQKIWAGRLSGRLRLRLLAFAGCVYRSALTAALLNFIPSLLQHALKLNLFGLLAMNCALKTLDHAM
ncbi:MAG: hypothetical protein L0K44_10960, partial [Yaniella sp.]|nr:hypothetical protein [Yaniella sp.]